MTNVKRLPRARGGEFQTATTPRMIQRGNPQRSAPETEIPAKIRPKTEIRIEIAPKLPQSGVHQSVMQSSTQQDKPKNVIVQPKGEVTQEIQLKHTEPQRVIKPTILINREPRENIKPKELPRYLPEQGNKVQLLQYSNPQRPREDTKGSVPSIQQIGEGIFGVLESIGSNFLDANRALYESGQAGRTGRYEEEVKELLDGLKKAEDAMEILKQDNASQSEIQSQQNIINAYYQKLIAYSTVLGDNIQQLATQSTARLSDQLEQSAGQHVMSAKEGLNASGQMAIDAAMMGTQFLGDMAVNTVIPGGGLLALGLDAFGSQTKDARQKGADLGTQLAAGTGSALLGMGLEGMTNLAPSLQNTYGSGAVDDLLAQLTKIQEDRMGEAFLAGFTEGTEDFLEALAQTALQKMTYDPDAQFSLEDALKQAVAGAAFGATVSSLDSLVSSAKKDGFLSGFYEKEIEEAQGQYVNEDADLIAGYAVPLENRSDHAILNTEESGSVTRYIGGSPYTLNQKLRDGVELTAEEAQSAAALDAALDKLPIYQGTVTRDLIFFDLNEHLSFVKKCSESAEFSSSGFMSATTLDSYQDAPHVRMLIQSKTARDLRAFNPDEAEVLFPRNTKFHIVSMYYEGDTLILEMIEK